MRKDRGFTLLEVIVSLAILAIALVAILGIRDRNIRTAVETERLARATLIASRIMGEIELEGIKNMDEGVEEGFRWIVSKDPSPFEQLNELRLALWWDGKKVIEFAEYIP